MHNKVIRNLKWFSLTDCWRVDQEAGGCWGSWEVEGLKCRKLAKKGSCQYLRKHNYILIHLEHELKWAHITQKSEEKNAKTHKCEGARWKWEAIKISILISCTESIIKPDISALRFFINSCLLYCELLQDDVCSILIFVLPLLKWSWLSKIRSKSGPERLSADARE